MTRRLAISVLLAALGAAAVRCSRPTSSAESAPAPGEIWLTPDQIRGARIEIAAAELRDLAVRIVTAGRVAFDDARVAHVFSPVSGRVTRVLAPLGKKVRRGDPLAVIESPDLASAWSDLVKARADATAAEHELQRQRALYEHHASAERDFETAQDNAEKSRAEIERARLRLRTLHALEDGPATQEFLLRSPIAGTVVARTATPGLEVQGMLASANVVAELFTVGDADVVWVWGDVYERDLGRVRAGQRAAITAAPYPQTVVSGAVDYVAETLDPQTHTAKLRCSVHNPDRILKPEMFVTVAVELGARRQLALPRGAVIRMGDRQSVFVEDGSTRDGRRRFLQRPVETGDADAGWIGISSGLQPGERVVVAGSILLSGAG